MESRQAGRSFTTRESWTPYRGKVYCATVSTGALLVRRNNKVVVSGNSPLEHNLITYRVICPIFVDRQFVRHRVGVSKNERSLRYTEAEDAAYIPTAFRQQAPSNRQASVEDDGTLDQAAAAQVWAAAWQHAYQAYQDLLALGVAREQARGVLPLSLYTTSYYTFNLRSLLHFLELRDHPGAQHEAQLYARAMAELAEPLFPVVFREWRALREN
ncbi:FAD-dependent thymidylate synthase [Deinococcus sp. S9]|nr:FAD-dependent thymidylate synthase [Deinococcus sp. S9]